MNKVPAVESLPFDELDATLLRLLAEYRLHGEHSPAAQTLFRDFLPTLTKSLAYEFPQVSPEDILYFTWDKTRSPGLELASSPCAYLMHCVRDSLRRKRRADRHGVSENLVKSRLWIELTEELGLEDSEVFVLPVGDDEAAVLNSVTTPTTRQSTPLWDELCTLLTQLGWTQSLAAEAVDTLECSMDSLSFDFEKAVNELPSLVPESHREALVAFVASPRGYLSARLRGMSRKGAIELPLVQTQLPSLAFTDSPTLK